MAIQREYLSPNEIAEYLGVSPFTIRRYIKLGELRAVKLLGGFRVHREELQKFLKAHEVNPSDEELLPEEVTTEPAAPVPEAALPPEPPGPAPEAAPPPRSPAPLPAPEPAPRRTAPGHRSKSREKRQSTRAKKKALPKPVA